MGLRVRLPASERLRGHGVMLIVALLLGGSFSFGKLAAPHIDPKALTAVRFVIACVGLAAIVFVSQRMNGGGWSDIRRQLSVLAHAQWRFLILGGLYGFYFVMMFEGLRLTEPETLSAVFTLTPLITAAVVFLLFRQTTQISVLSALLVGAAGAVWVIFDGRIDDILALRIGAGEIIFFFGVIAHSLYIAFLKRFQGGDPLFAFVLGIVIGALLLVTVTGLSDIFATAWAGLPSVVWYVAVYLGVFATAITVSLMQYASRRLPAPKVMAYTYLIPAVVIVIEGVSGRGWAPAIVLPGVAAILTALALLVWRHDPADG